MSDRNDLTNLTDKEFRDEYMSTLVRAGICYQIQALREQLGLSQTDFAQKTGKLQSTISRLENVEHSRASVQTLLDIACTLDIALLVRFVPYTSFLEATKDMSPEGLKVENFDTSLRKQLAIQSHKVTSLSLSHLPVVGTSTTPNLSILPANSNQSRAETWTIDAQVIPTNHLTQGQSTTGRYIAMQPTSGLAFMIYQ